jgi:hypothetical protein
MNGFDSSESKERRESAPTTPKIFDMTRHEIQRRIARGHRLRAEQLTDWSRNVAQRWASLFRGPGRLLPTRTRSRDRLANPAKL